ncbi:MAG TPA: methionine--tRNA ligase [Nitrososphaerales archaeon]|nr:methionine--tRNA ligase [Nitrososphaerales archaeon]
MDELSTQDVIITAALPYAYDDLHLGHVASTHLPPDILYRYLKLKGTKVIQVCASDDFGTPILIAAEKQGKNPCEYVAGWNARFKEDLGKLGIVYDLFDRTSSPENVELVQRFFTKLNENGFIFVSEINQFYCEYDLKFLPDRYVKGKCPYCGTEDQYSDVCENCGRTLQPGQILNPHCSICGRPPVLKKSTHYFFKLSALSHQLQEWLENNQGLQADAKNYVLNWIKDGLQDWDITRDISWGVPIPLKEAHGKVLYGWFDNHLCYISTALKALGKPGEEGREAWNKSKIYHFIGKDIVYHHYLFLPSMRIGEGEYKLPDFIPTRGHLLLLGKKVSRSKHWMITIREFLDHFPPDYLRFYLTRIVPQSQSDANFDLKEFEEKINNELVANVGNFVYRALSFAQTKHGGSVPEAGKAGEAEEDIIQELEGAVRETGDLIEQGHYDRALRRVLDFSAKCNQYFQHRAPWEKGADEPTTVFYACNLVAGLATLLNPFLPFTSEEIWNQLGFEDPVAKQGWDSASELRVEAGKKLREPRPLFKKVEDEDLKSVSVLLG